MNALKAALAWALALVIVVGIIAVLVGGPTLFQNSVILEPERQRGYQGTIGGLVAAYCTAPGQQERENARIDLRGYLEGSPARLRNVPPPLRARAEAAVENNQQGACQ